MTLAERRNVERFEARYRQCCSPVAMEVERGALGADYGSAGFTTRGQADELAHRLGLGPGTRLADLGAGTGWPGLYLAQRSGCLVVGSDLPIVGLARARARAIADGLADRASFVVATGRDQPFRSGAFDAVVHTDVLCCLGPKLAVLRACRRLLRPGGRMAFTTIHVAPGLDAARRRRAVRAGPWHVATRQPYAELVERAGFDDVVATDVTAAYARTQRAWCEASEARASELGRMVPAHELAVAAADRRRALAAIEGGLLVRTLLSATAG